MKHSISYYPGTKPITILCLFILYTPLIVISLYSFNSLRSITTWGEFTFDWYIKAFSNPAIQNATMNSLLIAVLASSIATLIALAAAMGMLRGAPLRKQKIVVGVINLPLLLPEIVVAVASLIFFIAIDMTLGLGTILLAHIVFCIPFAYLPISTRLKDIKQSFDEAAYDLYASRWQAFRHVTLPMAMPGIVSGLMLAFVVSLDDFIVANMVAGPGSSTLPMTIYSMLRIGLTPEINAISTILLLISILFVTASWWCNRSSKSTT
ncbi:ABC transporter permease [Psychromonas sp. 14N.309.X.WAT.B.A12]|jgi:spermidine/putrescine transport system permease protein|uniref:ABC transporter permease n=1 Tax=unclassified Psychromonas TaxID=2614957 RepID=UPI0025B0F8B2|nr:ABC transporter permease [Psychromonas sp. 14N.309.X.WAT.B.A12]MDN2663228.1 ABC transporter permease [Psychromonas sp. 14N.309.X.WAT.B.A12]